MIYFNMRRMFEYNQFGLKLFSFIVLSDLLVLLLDTAMWLLDGIPGRAGRAAYSAVTVFYYIMNPAICLLWFSYVHYYIFQDTVRLKKDLLPLMLPELAVTALAVSSPFVSGLLFTIGGDNVYHRGKLFVILLAVSLFYLVLTFLLTLKNHQLIQKRDYIPMLAFMLPPVAGAVLQSCFYGLSLVWPCTTLSILFVFTAMQNNRLSTDHLTGLYNRRQLDRYLNSKLQNIGNGKLAGLMLDLDSFKAINDTYGHQAGDQALVKTAEILRKTFRKDDFIARYGGDEFVVIISADSMIALAKAVERLNANVAIFNEQKTVPYAIQLSIGYDCIFDGESVTVEDFLNHIDTLMYRNKSATAPLGPREGGSASAADK